MSVLNCYSNFTAYTKLVNLYRLVFMARIKAKAMPTNHTDYSSYIKVVACINNYMGSTSCHQLMRAHKHTHTHARTLIHTHKHTHTYTQSHARTHTLQTDKQTDRHTHPHTHCRHTHTHRQEKLNIYPYVNGITNTNGGRLINVHKRIAIVTGTVVLRSYPVG